ncbi:hypothetical protein [Leptolyngbya ohadii]|uniref:hypothetical protein n=1 Tax=Leptolyngbya ohadii TaxID=1962290 RepID=UPI000B59C81A|nr:hypothetical protein [Leptolyngbya ohadii]
MSNPGDEISQRQIDRSIDPEALLYLLLTVLLYFLLNLLIFRLTAVGALACSFLTTTLNILILLFFYFAILANSSFFHSCFLCRSIA